MGSNISIDFVRHRYGSRGPLVLQDIDCRIGSGEQLAIVGRSGCGKSTLLHMIAGLLRPSEGVVRIDGAAVTKPSAKWNMMFQKASLFPWMNVVENASLGLLYKGVSKRKAQTTVLPIIEKLGLADKANTNVQRLSGGQQQRVALARSLATQPDALLLDEPFSALDTFTRKTLQSEVSEICRDAGITLVLVTHDIDEAILMADRVVLMADSPGRIEDEVAVPLEWPRDSTSTRFTDFKQSLLHQFDNISNPIPRKIKSGTNPDSVATAA